MTFGWRIHELILPVAGTLIDAETVQVQSQCAVTRLSRNLFVSLLESANPFEQVPGTSDASKTQSGLTRT
jgi:hypothetical protein